MNLVPIYIPINPYLYLFLQDELGGESDKGPIVVSHQSVFGQYMIALVKEVNKPAKKTSIYCVELLVPERNTSRENGYDARYQHVGFIAADIKVFNKLLEEVFNLRYFARLETMEAMNLANQRGGSKKGYLEELCEKYSTVKGELTYPMLRMRHDRWKEKGGNLVERAIKGN